MPGGKRRLKQLFTTGLLVGGAGTFITSILSGSVAVTAPSFAANSAGSADTVDATISGLTTNHKVVAFPMNGMSGCTAMLSACPSAANTLTLTFGYTAGSGGAKADEATVTVGYLALKTA